MNDTDSVYLKIIHQLDQVKIYVQVLDGAFIRVNLKKYIIGVFQKKRLNQLYPNKSEKNVSMPYRHFFPTNS